MEGIVSLLDEEHSHLTESLWSELESEFGLRGIYITPFPHFSYHVAQGYDKDELGPILQRVAKHTQVFQIQASGLGIFAGTPPVLYVPIVRTRELSELHATVWQQTAHTASGAVDYYRPEDWLPHITLAFGDIHKDNLPDVIHLLSERPLHWHVTINNLSFIEDTGQGQEVRFRFDFGR
jgi:2'-5' RNA ligase